MAKDFTERLSFLIDRFKIFTKEDIDDLKTRIENDDFESTPSFTESYEFIRGHNKTVIAIIKKIVKVSFYDKSVDEERYERIRKGVLDNASPNQQVIDEVGKLTIEVTKEDVWVSEEIFTNMVSADPTSNKMCVQWMLRVFTNFLKDGKKAEALRFGEEDLEMAKSYLEIFEANKYKDKFTLFCNTTHGLKDIESPRNINQYKSLSQLFNAVDPFMERENSTLEKAMQRFVDMGLADIPFRDRKWLVYTPMTSEANQVMESFASWCTAQQGSNYFDRYTRKDKTPYGKDSTIYVIVNTDLFTGESTECYQLHVETDQLKSRENSMNVDIYEPVIKTSDGIAQYFKETLEYFAKGFKGSLDNNKYITYLLKFGFSESLFTALDENLPTIKLRDRRIPKIPSLDRFHKVDVLSLNKVELVEVHPSIFNQTSLTILALPNNKLTSIPKEISRLKKLQVLTIYGNKITDIPESIAQLDPSNGGSLFRVTVNKADIGEDGFKRLKKLLPTVVVTEKV